MNEDKKQYLTEAMVPSRQPKPSTPPRPMPKHKASNKSKDKPGVH